MVRNGLSGAIQNWAIILELGLWAVLPVDLPIFLDPADVSIFSDPEFNVPS